MNIVILDDYQDAVRKLDCAVKLDAYPAKVFTNTVKGVGQLSIRLRDADVLVLIRERTPISRQLVEKLPKLKLIAQTGRVGKHIDVGACTERGIAVAEGVDRPWHRRTDLGVDHGVHAAFATVCVKPQTRGLATIGAEGPVHAHQLWPGIGVERQTLGVWSYGKLAPWWRVMAAHLACGCWSGAAKTHANAPDGQVRAGQQQGGAV